MQELIQNIDFSTNSCGEQNGNILLSKVKPRGAVVELERHLFTADIIARELASSSTLTFKMFIKDSSSPMGCL